MKALYNVRLQENYNTPVEHTPGNPPSQLWKESLQSLLVKGLGDFRGVFRKVCWNNLGKTLLGCNILYGVKCAQHLRTIDLHVLRTDPMGRPDFSAIVSGAFKGASLQQQAAEFGGFWSFSCFWFDICIPRAPRTPIFEGQPPKTKPFPTKTKVIWVLGICICIHILPVYHTCNSVMTAWANNIEWNINTHEHNKKWCIYISICQYVQHRHESFHTCM